MDENFDLEKLIKKTGIQLVPSDDYTPNENSKAENAHKMRSEIAQMIQIHTQLPKSFWAEAGQMVRIIKGIILTKEQNQTPDEKFYGRKSDI